VLVVDADPDLTDRLCNALRGEGFDPEPAASGAAALAAAIADVPDLVICEVELPDMSGWNFIRQLRSAPQFAFVPVIFLSSQADETVRVRGFRLGADDVLRKPLDVGDVALRVARVLADSYRIEHAVRGASGEAAADLDVDGGMRGTLDEVGLSTLLTIFEVERAGGVLTVTNSDTGQVGRLYFRSGRTVRARYQGIETPTNREVVYGMLRWSRGHFVFRGAYVAGEDEMEASAMRLLIEGARRLDDETRAIQLRREGGQAADLDASAGPPLSAEETERMMEAGKNARRRSSQRLAKTEAGEDPGPSGPPLAPEADPNA